MDESAIADQAALICANVSGIQVSCSYDEAPYALEPEDLPTSVVLIGPMVNRDVGLHGGRASDGVFEGREFLIRVYCLEAIQGQVGDAIAIAEPLFALIYAAFDGRPKLVNADGSSPADFDWDTAGLARAFLVRDSGIVILPYALKDYFAIEFVLRCDGRRATSKVAETA